MQQPRVRTPGWAAFDREQRAKDGTLPECDADPFPSISNVTCSGSAKSLVTNNSTSTRSFSSVVRPHVKCPILVNNQKSGLVNDNSGAKHLDHQVTAENHVNPAVKMLKDLHSWADQNLIKDVLAAVNNDVDQASIFLKAMVSPDSKIKNACCSDLSSSISIKDKCWGESLSIDNKLSDVADAVLISRNCPSTFMNDNTKFSVESMPIKNKLPDVAHEVLISRRLASVPAEPEWEENDVYLSHRKDAIKMMRYDCLTCRFYLFDLQIIFCYVYHCCFCSFYRSYQDTPVTCIYVRHFQ